MGSGIYLAGAAMIAREVQQEALVHNLANVSTPGYKATRMFAEELEDVEASVDSMRETEKNHSFYIDFSQGPVEQTGRDLDVALEGDGFFTVMTEAGERFTRNGNFTLDAEGRLVTRTGNPVLTETGPVVLRELDRAGAVRIQEDGEIYVEDRWVGRLWIRDFESTDGLEIQGDGLFGPRSGFVLRDVPSDALVRQRCLEQSNVHALDEMVRMMSQLRSYESSQRMIEMQNQAQGQTVNDLITR